MHLLLLAESQPEFLPKLMGWIMGRRYPIGVKTPRITVSEFKLLNITFPMEWKEPFMKDLNRWCKGDKRYKKFYENFIFQQALKKSEIITIDLEKLWATERPTTAEQGNPQFRAYLYPIGFIKDPIHDPDKWDGHGARYSRGQEKV